MSVQEAAEKLRKKHNIDEVKASECWKSGSCYFCGNTVEVWTVPRILPLCGTCGKDGTIPIIAEEGSIWYYATVYERQEFLTP